MITKRDKFTLMAGLMFAATLINFQSQHFLLGLFCAIMCIVCVWKAIK